MVDQCLFNSVYQTSRPCGRLSLKLPLDHCSEGELDSLNGDSPCDEIHTHKHRPASEISPTDSAFHSDDFSPEGSRYDGPVVYFSDYLETQSTPSPDITFTSGVLDRRKVHPADSREYHEESFLNKQPWRDSNWSLESNPKRTTVSAFHVPLVIPVPSVPVKPRVGQFAIDEISELSETNSVCSLDVSSDSDDTSFLSFVLELKDCRIGTGQVARFRCQLQGKSALSVTWTHCGRTVVDGGRYRVYRHGPKHSLEIYFTTFADSGTVRCQAISDEALIETAAHLRIRESRLTPKPPEFVYKLQPQELVQGDDAELSCRVRGHPVPLLKFSIDGRKISSMDSGFVIDHIGNEEWLLLIDGKRLLSSCTIHCLAANPLGETASSAAVLVVTALELTQARSILNVDGRLKNLDKKLMLTKKQMLNNAEEMLINATQMSTLEHQLSVVDEYLDRIESKFEKTKNHKVDSNSICPPPPALSAVQLAASPVQSDGENERSPNQPGEASKSSITVSILSKTATSDKVNVIFKKSFASSPTTPAKTFSKLCTSRPDHFFSHLIPDTEISFSEKTIGGAAACVWTKEKDQRLKNLPSESELTVPVKTTQSPSYPVSTLSTTSLTPELTVQKIRSDPWEELLSGKQCRNTSEWSTPRESTVPRKRYQSLPVLASARTATVCLDDNAEWQEDCPFPPKNIKKQLADSSNMPMIAVFPPPPQSLLIFDNELSSVNYRVVKNRYNPDYRVDSVEPLRPCSATNRPGTPEPALLQRAEEKVSRTTDRLQHLDNRIDILHKEFGNIEREHCSTTDLKRLESAVVLTAAEIQATERTIKQVESLVSRLHTQQRFAQGYQAKHNAGRSARDHNWDTPQDFFQGTSVQPAVVTYSSMTSTPQDFPQDGPSVKSLLSRFQNDKPKTADAAHHPPRRIGSAASEEGSEDSIASSPDKDRKPLPVFNKAKFQEGVAANRSQPRSKMIHASLTARSLSREMREQLRISRPQMGAFRSNIMTAENGEYDPERAAKAKELFIAESAQLNNQHVKEIAKEHKSDHKNTPLNRFKQEPFMEDIHHEEPQLHVEAHNGEERAGNAHAHEHLAHVNGHVNNENGHFQQHKNGSGNFDDSLEEELEHEHDHDEDHGHENDLPEDDTEGVQTDNPTSSSNHYNKHEKDEHQSHHDEQGNHHNQHEEISQHKKTGDGNYHINDERFFMVNDKENEGNEDERQAAGFAANHTKQETPQDDEQGDIPLSQAPDWALLI